MQLQKLVLRPFPLSTVLANCAAAGLWTGPFPTLSHAFFSYW